MFLKVLNRRFCFFLSFFLLFSAFSSNSVCVTHARHSFRKVYTRTLNCLSGCFLKQYWIFMFKAPLGNVCGDPLTEIQCNIHNCTFISVELWKWDPLCFYNLIMSPSRLVVLLHHVPTVLHEGQMQCATFEWGFCFILQSPLTIFGQVHFEISYHKISSLLPKLPNWILKNQKHWFRRNTKQQKLSRNQVQKLLWWLRHWRVMSRRSHAMMVVKTLRSCRHARY